MKSLFICYIFIPLNFAAKILFIPAHNMASHTKSMYPFAEALAAQNNDVHVLQILEGEHDKAKGKNVKDIHLILPKGDTEVITGAILWTTKITHPLGVMIPWYATTQPCIKMLHDPKFLDEFLKIVHQPWDVLIVDGFFAACGMLATHLNDAPWIQFSTSLIFPDAANILGRQWKPAYSPSFRPSGKFDSSDFWDRLWSTHDSYIVIAIFRSLQYLLPRWTDHPLSANLSVHRYYSQSSLALGSIPYELDFPHSTIMNIIELDGSCPKLAQLPENYAKFLEDPASKGTILFAMGHFGDWQYAPPHALQSFVDAFNELSEYRIIWQYVSKGEKPKVGRHIMLDSWIPQTAILYHNKTVLFVSHVGFKSFRESICAKVPIVAMPMFAEQLRITAFARQRGFGVFLDKMNISKENVLNSMKQVLNNRSYKKNVEKMSRFASDRILDSMKLGTFWFDFLLRHKESALNYLRQKVLPSIFSEYSPILSIIAFCLIFTSVLF